MKSNPCLEEPRVLTVRLTKLEISHQSKFSNNREGTWISKTGRLMSWSLSRESSRAKLKTRVLNLATRTSSWIDWPVTLMTPTPRWSRSTTTWRGWCRRPTRRCAMVCCAAKLHSCSYSFSCMYEIEFIVNKLLSSLKLNSVGQLFLTQLHCFLRAVWLHISPSTQFLYLKVSAAEHRWWCCM